MDETVSEAVRSPAPKDEQSHLPILRSRHLGPAARPVAVPDDLEAGPKAAGVVTLPSNVRWSEPERTYDLGDRDDRARVYEQVLRDGTAADVRRDVDADLLLELWDDLVLPVPVRQAWAAWFRAQRRLDLRC
jgi:hypothetical protein